MAPPKTAESAAIEALWFDAKPDELVPLISTGRLEDRRLAVRALGQVGEQQHVAVITQLLYADDPALVGTAARALGVMGRRKLALDEIPSAALRLAAKSDPWGAGYLLANLAKPREEDGALAREVAGRAEARWIALRGLPVVEPDLARQLDDPSLVVRVEAVRLLAGKKATPAARRALVAWVRDAWAVPVNRRPPAAQPVLEALRLLEPQVLEEPQAAELFVELAVPTGGSLEERRVLDEVACLRASAAVRGGGPYAPLLACGEPSGRGWPVFKRRELVLELIDGGRGSDAERLAAMESMWGDRDPRVRGIGAAAAVKLNRFDVAVRALRESIVIAGPTVDELATKGKAKPLPPEIETALLVRAEAELDADEPELLIGLLDALGTSTDPRTATVRARAARSGIAAVRKAANATPDGLVLDPPSGLKAPAPSRTVRGAGWRLKVTTSRGVFHIDLDPTIAPTAVSALVTLAERRFYDGLIFHRVVPNFVVQGGDPTGSGWGGAGFLLPSERSTLRYVRGAVGLADSGLDTAGSQWFVTLQESPHLEGRYTIIGHVPDAEMKVVDQLLVGDVMTRVEVIAPMIPTVLVIAGLDPSAGAGILADTRVCAEHDVRVVGVITATTVQDTHGVRAATPVPPEEVGDALRAILADVEVQAIKIGMLATVETARVIAECLAATRAPVVWDPVLLPSRGGVLLLEGDVREAARLLLPEARLVTPNLDETGALLGEKPPGDLLSMVRAASTLRKRGVAAVLVKGGHLAGAESPDVLDDAGDVDVLTGARREVGPLHGTGCVLSSAIASGLALGRPLAVAVRDAKQYLTAKLDAPLAIGRGARVLI